MTSLSRRAVRHVSLMDTAHSHVQEMQGLYGPYTIAERVVQKIWLRRDFDQTNPRLDDGRTLAIRTPGAWNLLGGPDFRDARLAIDGVSVVGDVEVHFHLSDWRAHGHGADPAYDNVVLHAVLFPPAPGERSIRHRDGREIPTLVLLPLLHRSLEEHASDEALESITARDAAERIADLAALPRTEMIAILRRHAEMRWAQKTRFAALRIEKLGWPEAAHHTALEILGYRHNRAAMLAVAAMHPLAEWGGRLEPDNVFEERRAHWQTQGVRPANHPRLRLRQYHRWVAQHRYWPEALRGIVVSPSAAMIASRPTALIRKDADLVALRDRIFVGVLGNTLGGSRMDTLVCDGFLPLLEAMSGQGLFPMWFHWFMGDVPFDLRGALGMLGVAGRGASPFCHGWAQGLLGWMSEQEVRASS